MKPAHPVLGDGFVHFSNLRHIARSPAHYRVAVERRSEPTPAMRFGSLVHALLLGGVPICVWDGSRSEGAYKVLETVLAGGMIAVWEGTRNQKGYKAFVKENEGRTIATSEEYERARAAEEGAIRDGSGPFLIVTQDEHDRARFCADAVRSDPESGPLLVGRFEQTIEWEYQDRACSSRLDILSPDGDVDELKTTTNTDPEILMRAYLKMGYHGQLAFYRRAAESIGVAPRHSRIIGVETQPPFVVTVLNLTPSAILAGEKLVRIWMEKLLGCERVDKWPGYVQRIVDWELDESANDGVLIDGEEVEAA